jgi:hypothetical protein
VHHQRARAVLYLHDVAADIYRDVGRADLLPRDPFQLHRRHRLQISAWRSEGGAAISRNPIAWGIWAISTVIFLGIAILAIVASIIG